MNIIHNEDCISGMKKMADNSVDCCVTSPPYFRLRNYGTDGQIGLEETPELFVEKMVEAFEQVRRVLKPSGTLWLNLGDSYATHAKGKNSYGINTNTSKFREGSKQSAIKIGLKDKDLIGIPWMTAFALRSQGWYLRQDIIWSKPSCMPESVLDRCTKSHEYIFLLSKSKTYYYNYESIQEEAVWDVDGNGTLKRKLRQNDENKNQPSDKVNGIRKIYEDVKTGTAIKSVNGKRNKRSVWTVNPTPFSEAHFATFPERLIIDCIKAGCPENGIVLDPFMGAGTTALVARKLNRNYVGFELNSDYIEIANDRLYNQLGMFP